jgi:Domain of unknown function (DUF4258)
MKSLSEVRRQLAGGQFECSRHAFRRIVERNISEQEIREAGVQAAIIEDYPDDKYGPSGLLLGIYVGWTSFAFSSNVHRVGSDEDRHNL